MFKKKNIKLEEIKESQESINKKLFNEIGILQKTIDRLEAELFSIKNPNGELSFHPPYLSSFSYNSRIHFTYSNGYKIYRINIKSPYYAYSFYKMQVVNGKAYVGIKYKHNETSDELKESYYIIDIYEETFIEIENNTLENLDSIEWTKNE